MATKEFPETIESVVVRAHISLCPTAEGGRQLPIWNKYRPNHVFEYPDAGPRSSYIGEIHLEDKTQVAPGEDANVTILFLNVPSLLPYLTVGRKWWLHEGSRLVGHAEITAVL